MARQVRPAFPPRLPGLDLLRAIAVGWVMVYHASNYGLIPNGTWLVDSGWMGVDLFFVLSGFLIASQLLRPLVSGERPNYTRFFTRRAFRTLPAYAAMLALYALVPVARDRDHMQPLWTFLTFTQNLTIHVPPPQALSHAWSLCVEEQFYLVFPIAVAVLSARLNSAKTVSAMVVIVLLGMGLRGWFWLHDVARTSFDLSAESQAAAYLHLIYYPTWTRLDGLLAGIGAGLLMILRPSAWTRLTVRPNLLLMGGLLGVGSAVLIFKDEVTGFYGAVFGYPILSISMAALVIAGTSAKSLIGRHAIPGVGTLAAVSYSLYLTHKMVYNWVAKFPVGGSIGPLLFPVAILAAVVVGAVLYRLVELPFLRLRDQISGPPTEIRTAATTVETQLSGTA